MKSVSTALTIAEVTGLLTSDFDLAALLRTIAARTRTELDAVSVAIVVSEADGNIGVVARSADPAVPVDSRVHRHGPPELCARSGVVVMVEDFSVPQHQWPEYQRIAVECGFGSLRAYPLTLHRKPLGALVVHAAGPWGTERNSIYAQAMADLASVALGSSEPILRVDRSVESVRDLMASIVIVDQAIGMLAEITGADVDSATASLHRGAREQRLSIGECARSLVAGEIRWIDIAPEARPA